MYNEMWGWECRKRFDSSLLFLSFQETRLINSNFSRKKYPVCFKIIFIEQQKMENPNGKIEKL